MGLLILLYHRFWQNARKSDKVGGEDKGESPEEEHFGKCQTDFMRYREEVAAAEVVQFTKLRKRDANAGSKEASASRPLWDLLPPRGRGHRD